MRTQHLVAEGHQMHRYSFLRTPKRVDFYFILQFKVNELTVKSMV